MSKSCQEIYVKNVNIFADGDWRRGRDFMGNLRINRHYFPKKRAGKQIEGRLVSFRGDGRNYRRLCRPRTYFSQEAKSTLTTRLSAEYPYDRLAEAGSGLRTFQVGIEARDFTLGEDRGHFDGFADDSSDVVDCVNDSRR